MVENESGELEERRMVARSYQLQMEKCALASNTILFLPTGSGKTFIAIQVIKRLQKALYPKYSEGGQRSFFIVNSVPLVPQQVGMLSRQLPLNVKGYSSENKVDLWKLNDWLQQLEEAQVLVMTAQILADMLAHNYITLDRINLLVFDECHHAVAHHPMRAIMKYFNTVPDSKQPKVLGLTATLINKNIKVVSISSEIRMLESTFNAKICTVDVLDEVRIYSTDPTEICLVYPEVQLHHGVRGIFDLFSKLRDIVEDIKIPVVLTRKAAGEGEPLCQAEKVPKSVKNTTLSIERCFKELGVYGGSLSILFYIVMYERLKLSVDIPSKHNILQLAITYLNHARSIAEQIMSGCSHPADRLLKFSSPKVKQICELLKEYSPEMIASGKVLKVNKFKVDLFGLIFVKERFTCKVICKILEHASRQIPELGYLKCDYTVGANVNPYSDSREDLFIKKQNVLVVEKFRAHQINCLVCTEVMEEGIDIPRCNLVMRMDPILTFRSYVQAKGRGRHNKATYAIMVSEGESGKFTTSYNLYKDIEAKLNEILIGTASTRAPPSQAELSEKYKEVYPSYEHNNARITIQQSISLLCRYCQTLPHDKFTQLTPEYYLVSSLGMKTVNIYLPLSCPVREMIKGVPMSNIEDAKKVAALRACEALHKAKELNDRLLPITRNPEHLEENIEKMFFSHWVSEESDSTDEKTSCRTGSKGRKRLHHKKLPKCLSGSKLNANNDVHTYYLQTIRLTPHYESDCEDSITVQDLIKSTRGYLLLTAHPLPRVCPFTIFLSSGRVTVTLVNNNQHLVVDSQHLDHIKKFHMLVFLDVLNIMKDYMCYDTTHGDNHYWVVPTDDGETISWDTIRSYHTVEAIKEPTLKERIATSTDPDHYRHMVVAKWYRNSGHAEPKYIVTKVLGITPGDAFSDGSHDSYITYFKSKYNLSLLGSGKQPMLEVQYVSGKMNCLLPRSVSLNSGVKKKKLIKNLEQQYTSHTTEQLVPEFCIRFSFPGVLWMKATMLPSILHRISHLFVAEDLRSQIAQETHLGCVQLPPDVEWGELSEDAHSVTKAQLDETDGGMAPNDVEMEEDESNELAMETDLDADCGDNNTFLNKMHNQDTYKLALNKLSKEYPWTADMEPIDLERQFDTVTLADIECYNKFVNFKIGQTSHETVTGTEISMGDMIAEGIKRTRAICAPPFKQVETIEILTKTIDSTGPQLRTILEALTTAKSNDIVSLERLETLGDSFLKFGVSLYLIHRFPHYDEGRLTALKSKMVSNRNLFYCGAAKEIPGMIKSVNFSAKDNWIPPAFCIERNLQKILIETQVPPSSLYFVKLSREEMLSGRLNLSSWESIQSAMLNWDNPVYAADTDMYVERQEVPDKVVADCVEALIGAYLQEGGISAAFKLLHWLQIIPEKNDAEDLLAPKVDTPYSQGKVDWKHVDFLLDSSIDKIQNILHYTFRDPCLLLEALTHSSNSRNRVTGSYERLEFLGDAILDFLITCHIYERGGALTPGQLTDLRSALVNNNTFACLVVRLGLHKFMQTSNALLDCAVSKFVCLQEGKGHVVDESVLHLLEEQDCQLAQYIEVPKVLGDIFESLVGAIFLDCGGHLPTVWNIFYGFMSNEIALFMQNVPKNPTRLILEQTHAAPRFQSCRRLQDGTTMIPLSVWVKGSSQLVYGFGSNKAMAKRSAAKIALRLLGVTS